MKVDGNLLLTVRSGLSQKNTTKFGNILASKVTQEYWRIELQGIFLSMIYNYDFFSGKLIQKNLYKAPKFMYFAN
ncbi:hypothetical protein CH373_06095 [Leptospira perolatii]|uniref:Uncharacterized protein n=1 Tax=Leptospira perolatii TaxID=2023191 RepID=A0A2M9ZNX0_9LEPT|nr:hypothetical protein CH360_04825 [Leptospira perolatii]PJZ73734.1 hypothetical protein CH373_06095 [Leptospira perolatii]